MRARGGRAPFLAGERSVCVERETHTGDARRSGGSTSPRAGPPSVRRDANNNRRSCLERQPPWCWFEAWLGVPRDYADTPSSTLSGTRISKPHLLQAPKLFPGPSALLVDRCTAAQSHAQNRTKDAHTRDASRDHRARTVSFGLSVGIRRQPSQTHTIKRR